MERGKKERESESKKNQNVMMSKTQDCLFVTLLTVKRQSDI